MAAGLGLLAQGGIHVQTKECSWNGVHTRSQHSTAKPSVTHPMDGIRNNSSLRWAVEPLPTVYHMEGSAIGAKGVQ